MSGLATEVLFEDLLTGSAESRAISLVSCFEPAGKDSDPLSFANDGFPPANGAPSYPLEQQEEDFTKKVSTQQ